MSKLNSNSIRTILLKPFSTINQEMPHATGFFVEKNNKVFLITNKHVVTGLDTFTGRELLPGSRPYTLNIAFEVYKPVSGGTFRHIKQDVKISLYQQLSDEGVPENSLWRDHGEKEIDVVALEITEEISKITETESAQVRTFLCSETEGHSGVEVMDEIFIAGFPIKNEYVPNQYPIYKYATVASEPDFTEDKPIFLVDGKTKPGMSGAPVIHRERADLKKEDGGNLTFSEGKQTIVGVYSGRYPGEDEYEAELGICWKFKECVITLLDQ